MNPILNAFLDSPVILDGSTHTTSNMAHLAISKYCGSIGYRGVAYNDTYIANLKESRRNKFANFECAETSRTCSARERLQAKLARKKGILM